MKLLVLLYLTGTFLTALILLWLEYMEWKLLTRKDFLFSCFNGLIWPLVWLVFFGVVLFVGLATLLHPIVDYAIRRLEKPWRRFFEWLDKPVLGG